MEYSKRAILVQRRLPGEKSYLHELRELAYVAGYVPVLEVEQIRKPDPAYHIGRGKARELAELVKEYNVEIVIFFNELKPIQSYNLSKLLGVDVIDRFQLILEIFVKRAGTREAKLQIELATLKHQLSYIREYINLAKRGELHGFMGGGEYALTVYEQHIRRRISKIEERLRKIREKNRILFARRSESGIYNIALTGYTGAGKTTLFNKLANENKYSDGKPFATLSPVRRKIKINGVPALISDTIGFIDSLPPLLFDAFYTTLAELHDADLILLLVDSSESLEEIHRKIVASKKILSDIGVWEKPLLVVLNKVDLLDLSELEEKLFSVRKLVLKDVIPISAKNGLNLDVLLFYIIKHLPGLVKATIKITPHALPKILSQLYSSTGITTIKSDGESIVLELLARKSWLSRFCRKHRVDVEVAIPYEEADLRTTLGPQTLTR
ncbi:MAG: GTPase HflX [Thermoproteales archaeon]|nr:GTPase HflX [Thermoproteales archaeon]